MDSFSGIFQRTLFTNSPYEALSTNSTHGLSLRNSLEKLSPRNSPYEAFTTKFSHEILSRNSLTKLTLLMDSPYETLTTKLSLQTLLMKLSLRNSHYETLSRNSLYKLSLRNSLANELHLQTDFLLTSCSGTFSSSSLQLSYEIGNE